MIYHQYSFLVYVPLIFLLPEIFKLFKLNLGLAILTIVTIIAFSQGLFEFVGIGSSFFTIVYLLLIASLLIISSISQRKNYIGRREALWLLLFLSVQVATLYLTSTKLILSILFYISLFLPLALVYSIKNIYVSSEDKIFLKNLFEKIILVQIISASIKFLLFREFHEPFIGTTAVLGGSASSILSFTAILYYYDLFLVEKKYKYLFLSIAMLCFGLVNAKRIVIFLGPLLFFLYNFLSQEKLRVFAVFKNLILFFVLAIPIVYTGLRFNSTLNPEREFGGSFDIQYALKYSSMYSTSSLADPKDIGRLQGISNMSYLLRKTGAENWLFGMGPGSILKSKYNDVLAEYDSYQDYLIKKIRLGYAGRTGFVNLAFQIGILGSTFYFLTFIGLIRALDGRATHTLLVRFIVVIIILDYFFYSMQTSRISASLLFCLNVILLKDE